MKNNLILLLSVLTFSSFAFTILPAHIRVNDGDKPRKVIKTDTEWKKILTPEQYNILREGGTERAFSSPLNKLHEDGTFYCAACHNALFSYSTKFESGTGWPSFYAPIEKSAVVEKTDKTLGMARTEILCHDCNGHLGHVFNDGPKPTGLRYCMNGAGMTFEKK